MLEVRGAVGATASAPAQAGLESLLRSGELTRHIARVRRIYRDRRRVLVDAIGDLPLVVATRGTDAGLHIVVDLPEWVDTQALKEQAGRRGVLLATLDEFHAPDRGGRCTSIVLGFAKSTPSNIRQALGALAMLPALNAGYATSSVEFPEVDRQDLRPK